jgi:glycosyltransferase involved in cell wall biosynthesis
LWLHDQINPNLKRGRRLASTVDLLGAMSVTIICVSHWQSVGVKAMLGRMGVQDQVRVHTIYNPIDDDLMPDGSPIDSNKLVFFSSQNRGLTFAIDAFRAMRRQMPELRLVLGNPGYKIRKSASIAGVTNLGPQPQARIHAEVRTALCTFCPNFVLPETFGLVFAESMALGTPVLTHDCGAANEVIGDPAQVLPITRWHRAYEHAVGKMSPRWRTGPSRLVASLGLFDPYIERIRAWRSGARPQTGPDPRFGLATVAAQWRELLDS